MYFKKDFSEYEPWSGAVDTYDRIVDEGKLDELENLLSEFYCEEIPTETDINDLLWFESDWVLENLGISESEEENEE